MTMENKPLLQVKDLTVTFGERHNKFTAVKNVSFDIFQGETFGLVGESGSGKTTIGRTVIRINPAASGEILYGERISGRISREKDREVTRKIQMIFQDPMASLNERAKVDYIVSEGLYNLGGRVSEEERRKKVAQALSDVGLLPEFASRFPHEFSGGQRQRIGIARALIMEPEFIIADEPISALDVSIRAQVLNLMAELQRRRGLTYLLISHDLSVMRFICDRIAVIHLGRIVELSSTEKLFAHPLHPYTRALLSAIPLPDPAAEKRKVLEVYDPSCHHYEADPPTWTEIEPGHFVLANQEELEKYRTMIKLNDMKDAARRFSRGASVLKADKASAFGVSVCSLHSFYTCFRLPRLCPPAEESMCRRSRNHSEQAKESCHDYTKTVVYRRACRADRAFRPCSRRALGACRGQCAGTWAGACRFSVLYHAARLSGRI